MRILIALTYYRPHVSGLTIYAERLGRALVRRGHRVTVLTSRFDRSLPANEEVDGLRIVRPWVAFRVSKGVIMPTFGHWANRLALAHDALSIHLPQFDAPGIALRGRLLKKPVVLTYHSDLSLPPTLFNRVANQVINAANEAAAGLADRIVAYTRDFAEHSPFLSRYLPKIQVIPPPVEIGRAGEAEVQAFRAKHNLEGRKVVGMAARLAAEKGVEYLLEAAPTILEKYPGTRFLFAGQCEHVLGEQAYERKIAPLLTALGGRWTFLGVLQPDAMAAFFKSCDVTVLPSINSTETFGLVQIESMICGTPVVAAGLPGVREPVRITGMGKVVPPRDPARLAEAVLEVIGGRSRFVQPPGKIAAMFSPDATAARYEALFEEIAKGKGRT
ncbi:MAG: glycosyltransferase family 4 protein [Anaerolineales bacterium]|nr:glycosyltransferase family 4 protein [Anaerolineales bacterium]